VWAHRPRQPGYAGRHERCGPVPVGASGAQAGGAPPARAARASAARGGGDEGDLGALCVCGCSAGLSPVLGLCRVSPIGHSTKNDCIFFEKNILKPF
jgi:hypothetical protein